MHIAFTVSTWKCTSTATYSESQQMVTSMCPHLSAANTFTFTSPAHSFHFDSNSRSFKIMKQQMIGCLEVCAQRRDCLQVPLVTVDHEKRIPYIHLLFMPLMPWGSTLTGQQESQAHLPGPVRRSIQFTPSYQSNTAARPQQLKNSIKSRRAWDCTSSSPMRPGLLLGPFGIATIYHSHLDFSGFAIDCTVSKIYGNFWKTFLQVQAA